MAIHFSLDFTTPFGIGDQVFVLHPPKDIPCHGGPAWKPYQKGNIIKIKLIFDLNTTNGLAISQPGDEQILHVDRVVYTIICPPLDHHHSAFSVECLTDPTSEPRLFANEEELQAYLQPESV